MSVTIRELDRKADRRACEAIDTSFETTSIFEMKMSARAIELVETPLAAPRTKRYAIDEVFAPWARWDHGWVADVDGTVRGFATAGYEAWHERVNLWFFYISPEYRRRGIGRALIARVEAHGKELGANHVWIETSTVNVPGVHAYERLGYALVGADKLYYGSYMPDESAVYLAKSI